MAPTAAHLSTLLCSLTSPTPENTSSTSEALTTHLQSSCIEPLTEVLLTHPHSPVRNLAALLLRTHQTPHFANLPPESLSIFAATCLERLPQEPHPPTRRAIIALFSTLSATHATLDALLPPVLHTLLASPDHALRQQAFLLPHRDPEHLRAGLADPVASVRHAALSAYATETLFPSPELINLLPAALKHTSATMPNDAAFPRVHAMLYEALANILLAQEFRPHFNDAFQHAVQTFADAPVDAAAPAVEFLVYACDKKPRTIRKAGLHTVAVRQACKVLLTASSDVNGHARAQPLEEDEQQEDRGFLAMRVLDAVATRPELSSGAFLEGYGTAVSSVTNPSTGILTGCFRIVAALAEGCSTDMTSHAEDVITRVLSLPYEHIMDAEARTASLDALNAVAKTLDTDEMPDEITTRIAEASLVAVVKGLRRDSQGVRKAACIALEPVLGLFRTGELGGRAGDVVDALAALDGTVAVEAVLAVGVLAENASEVLVESPKFQVLLRRTVEMMVANSSEDALTTAAAFEAAGALVSVCKDVKVVKGLAEHAVHGLQSEEPTVKQGAFSFFAHLADSVGGSSLLVYGERVLRSAVAAVEQKDMFVVTDEDGNLKDVNADEAQEDIGSVSVRTAYLDEKMVAVGCMGAFGTAAGSNEWMNGLASLPDSGNAVLGLLTRSSELADVMTGHFHSEIRVSAFRACCRLASGNLRAHSRKVEIGFCSLAYTDRVLSVVLEGLRDDDDLWVVTDLLNALSIFLAEIPPETIVTRKEDITGVLSLLIAGKATCQIQEEDEDLHDDIDSDEVDGMIEAIGDVVEALVRALRGHFAQHFVGLLEQILKTLYGPTQSGRSRGTVLGTVAGVLLFMCWERCPFPPPNTNDAAYELALSASDDLAAATVPLALDAIRSGDSRTLQRNAVFLLGVIFEHTRSSKTQVWVQLPAVLETLQRILQAGKSGNGALVDNAAGAVARIVTAKGLPQGTTCNRETMLQAALACVPLEDDPAENTTITRAIVQAAESGFDDLIRADAVVRVVSCLVTAILVHVETSRKRVRPRWVNTGTDPNDEIVKLDESEFEKVAKILQRIRQVHGEGVFLQLGLSEQDASIVAGVISR